MRCANVDGGCEWEGTVGTFDLHMATCEFIMVPCPKACRDDANQVKRFVSHAIPQHLASFCPNRDFVCVHCEERGTYASITHVHDTTCEKKVIPCPNADCISTMQRQGIKRHLEDCEHTEVPCKYLKLGCGAKMKRNATRHMDEDKLHLQMALDKISTLEESMKKDIYLAREKSLTFKLTEFQNKMDNGAPFFSPSFYTDPNGYHIVVGVLFNGRDGDELKAISVYAEILEGKNDRKLRWPFIGNVTCTLLNQLGDFRHSEKKICFYEEDNALHNEMSTSLPMHVHSWVQPRRKLVIFHLHRHSEIQSACMSSLRY